MSRIVPMATSLGTGPPAPCVNSAKRSRSARRARGVSRALERSRLCLTDDRVDPRIDGPLESRQWCHAVAEHGVVEACDTESRAKPCVRTLPQSLDLEPADHVARGLAGVGEVAIDLARHVGVNEWGRLREEPDRLVAGPFHRVQSGVDNQP